MLNSLQLFFIAVVLFVCFDSFLLFNFQATPVRCLLLAEQEERPGEHNSKVVFTLWKAVPCRFVVPYLVLEWDSSVVRAPDSWLKDRGFESLQERRDNFLVHGQLSVLLFWYPFHTCVTEVARKRSRSFCRKCRWKVTAKHAYTLRMWLCMKWQGAWLYGVQRTRRYGSSFTWHQPC